MEDPGPDSQPKPLWYERYTRARDKGCCGGPVRVPREPVSAAGVGPAESAQALAARTGPGARRRDTDPIGGHQWTP